MNIEKLIDFLREDTRIIHSADCGKHVFTFGDKSLSASIKPDGKCFLSFSNGKEMNISVFSDSIVRIVKHLLICEVVTG